MLLVAAAPTGCNDVRHRGMRRRDGYRFHAVQVLQHLGMHAEWYKQLPNGVPAEDATPNQKSAAWVKKIGKKPGPRRKAFSDHPQVVPPPDAAVQRTGSAAVLRKGRAPKISFPLLVALSRRRRPQASSACYNKVTAPTAVALVERRRVSDFVEKQLRCACGSRLRFDHRGSHQVAACAAWQFVCERSCKLPPLHTYSRFYSNRSTHLLSTSRVLSSLRVPLCSGRLGCTATITCSTRS